MSIQHRLPPWILRSLLALAFFVPLTRAAVVRADDRAVAESLRTAGATKIDVDASGIVTNLYFKDSSAITPEQWKLIGQLAQTRKMTFYNRCTLNDQTLPFLDGLVGLEEFACDGAEISDAALAHIVNWKHLKKVTFFHPSWKTGKFTGSGFAAFAGLPQLESFGLGGALFNDEGMAALGKLTRLKDLSLWHTRNTPAGNIHLEAFKELTSIYYSPDARTAADAVPHLLKLSKLEKITLLETRLTLADLSRLSQLKSLKTLILEKVDISPADLNELKARLPKTDVKWTAPDEKALSSIRKAFDEPKR